MKKTTKILIQDVPVETYRKFKAVVVGEGLTIKAVFVEMMEEYIKRKK